MEGTENSQCYHYFQAEKKYIAFSFLFGLSFRHFIHSLFCLVGCILGFFRLSSFKHLPTNCCFLDEELCFWFLNFILNWEHSYVVPVLLSVCLQDSEMPPGSDSNLKVNNTAQSCCLRASQSPKGFPEAWMLVLVINPNLTHTDGSLTASAPCPRRALCSSSAVVAVCDGPTNTE